MNDLWTIYSSCSLPSHVLMCLEAKKKWESSSPVIKLARLIQFSATNFLTMACSFKISFTKMFFKVEKNKLELLFCQHLAHAPMKLKKKICKYYFSAECAWLEWTYSLARRLCVTSRSWGERVWVSDIGDLRELSWSFVCVGRAIDCGFAGCRLSCVRAERVRGKDKISTIRRRRCCDRSIFYTHFSQSSSSNFVRVFLCIFKVFRRSLF